MKIERKKLSKKLIFSGFGAFLIFRIVTWILNIPMKHSFIAVIGVSLLIPASIGLFMYGISIEDYTSRIRRFLLFLSLYIAVSFAETILNFVMR